MYLHLVAKQVVHWICDEEVSGSTPSQDAAAKQHCATCSHLHTFVFQSPCSTSGCTARLVTMSINHITGGGGGLGSESAGTMRYSSGSFVDFSRLPIMESSRMAQHCGPTAAVAVVSRDPTFAPRTPATSPENNRHVHMSGLPQVRVSYGGMCPGRGQMSSTGADRTEPVPRPPCQETHTAFSLSRPGGVAVPWRTASIGLYSEVIQHPQLLPTRCPQPIALSHARHLICKCVTLTFLKV